jgi:hypothetical protein
MSVVNKGFIIAEDDALKTYLSGITVSDEKSPTRSVSVWFGYPDVEIREQKFPFITIDLVDVRYAANRQHSGYYYDSDHQGTQTPVSGKLYGYEMPIAYDLIYQVTSYARHPRHDRALAFQLMTKFPATHGHLPVLNDLGTSTAYRHMFLDSFLKMDRAEGDNGNKRLMRNIYTVRVTSEMTPTTALAALTQVNNVSINNNGATIPWTTTIPADKRAV